MNVESPFSIILGWIQGGNFSPLNQPKINRKGVKNREKGWDLHPWLGSNHRSNRALA